MIQLKQRKYFFYDNNTLNKGYIYSNDTDNNQTNRYDVYDHIPAVIDEKQQGNKTFKSVMHKNMLKQLQPPLLIYISMFIIYMFVFCYCLKNIPLALLQSHLLYIPIVVILTHLVDILNIHCLIGECKSDINEEILVNSKLRTSKQLINNIFTIFGRNVIKILCCVILGLFTLNNLLDNMVSYKYYIAQSGTFVTILSLYLISKHKIRKLMMIYDNNFASIKTITYGSGVVLSEKNNDTK